MQSGNSKIKQTVLSACSLKKSASATEKSWHKPKICFLQPVPVGQDRLERQFGPGDLVVVQFELDPNGYVENEMRNGYWYYRISGWYRKQYRHEFDVLLFSERYSNEQVYVRFHTNTDKNYDSFTRDQVCDIAVVLSGFRLNLTVYSFAVSFVSWYTIKCSRLRCSWKRLRSENDLCGQPQGLQRPICVRGRGSPVGGGSVYVRPRQPHARRAPRPGRLRGNCYHRCFIGGIVTVSLPNRSFWNLIASHKQNSAF